MTLPPILRRDDGPVATLTLNRPESFNALSSDLIAALEREVAAVGGDPRVRVVVLAASGKAFSAGHDLKEMSRHQSEEETRELFSRCARVMVALTRLPQPVIARVQGVATAAGCQLVAQCDLAVASSEARFATSGINVGLFCSAPMVALSRNLPRKQAMEMLLTGEFMDAETALRHGLVNRVVPANELDGAVAGLAERIAAKAPVAVALGKRLFYRQLEQGLEAAYDLAAQAMACNMWDAEVRAGVDAFAARKPMPQWKDRREDGCEDG